MQIGTFKVCCGRQFILARNSLQLCQNEEDSSNFLTAINRGRYVVGHPEADERRAMIYTLLGSCRRHGINPFDYLKDLFTRLPAVKIIQINELPPAEWVKANEKVGVQAA